AIGAAIFIAALIFVVRPFLKRLQLIFEQRGKLNQNMLALMIFLVLSCAFVSERMGINGFFGAFIFGVIMPKNLQFIRQLREKVEDFVVVFLLPLFEIFDFFPELADELQILGHDDAEDE